MHRLASGEPAETPPCMAQSNTIADDPARLCDVVVSCRRRSSSYRVAETSKSASRHGRAKPEESEAAAPSWRRSPSNHEPRVAIGVTANPVELVPLIPAPEQLSVRPRHPISTAVLRQSRLDVHASHHNSNPTHSGRLRRPPYGPCQTRTARDMQPVSRSTSVPSGERPEHQPAAAGHADVRSASGRSYRRPGRSCREPGGITAEATHLACLSCSTSDGHATAAVAMRASSSAEPHPRRRAVGSVPRTTDRSNHPL